MEISYKRELQRKLIHLSSLWMVCIIWILPVEHSMVLFGSLYLFMLSTEMLRLHSVKFNSFYNKLFIKILRKHEAGLVKPGFVGAYYVVLAVFIAITFFPKEIAIASISVMLISDTFAALIGKKYGKTKLLDKSLEGSVAFLLTGFISICTLHILQDESMMFLLSGFIAVFLSAISELFSRYLKIDDNLTIVLTMGVVMMLAKI